MKVTNTKIPEVKIVQPKIFEDSRGYFFESYNKNKLSSELQNIDFIQDNESFSLKNTFRGFHYQLPPFDQSKLVRVIQGTVIDFAVDIRKSSQYFKQFIQVELSEINRKQLFIPKGFAHAFLVLSETAIFQYKVDNYYSQKHERGFCFDSFGLDIDFTKILISDKDRVLPKFDDSLELFK